MINICQITEPQQSLLPDLCALLMDTVINGASVGFLSPLSVEKAEYYWQQVFNTLSTGCIMFFAEDDGKIIGSVQLSLCQKENGKHRAELQKLFVSSSARGKGIASKLMEVVESYALAHGCTLLVLDTQTGSLAEKVYQHFGWKKAGEIPDFAASPDGTLHPTSYYYKQLCKKE